MRLTLQYEEVFTTSILVTIDGSDFKFTSNLSKAAIVKTKVEDFEALKSSGKIEVTIENIGDNDSKFEVGLICSETIQKVPSKFAFLVRLEQKLLEFELHTNEETGKDHECKVRVANGIGEEVASEVVVFKTKNLQEVYVEDSTYENYDEDKVVQSDAPPAGNQHDYTEMDRNLTCNHLCPLMTNLLCFLVFRCYEHLITFLYGTLVIIGAMVGGSLLMYCMFCRREVGPDKEKKEKQDKKDIKIKSGDSELKELVDLPKKEEKDKKTEELENIIIQMRKQLAGQQPLALTNVDNFVKKRKTKKNKKRRKKNKKQESSSEEDISEENESESESNSEDDAESDSESSEEESPVSNRRKAKKKISKKRKAKKQTKKKKQKSQKTNKKKPKKRKEKKEEKKEKEVEEVEEDEENSNSNNDEDILNEID